MKEIIISTSQDFINRETTVLKDGVTNIELMKEVSKKIYKFDIRREVWEYLNRKYPEYRIIICEDGDIEIYEPLELKGE